MPVTTHGRAKTGRTLVVLAGFVVLAGIAFLSFSVAREIRLLGSASSDNVQWALAQTEVEFLEFTSELSDPDQDLTALRRRFDVFYSRMSTIKRASVFAELRQDPRFLDELKLINRFLDESVTIIDADDDVLVAQLPVLTTMAEDIRPDVRDLANSGLNLFAQSADSQRTTVARTMIQLAVALALLIGALAFVAFSLNRLNKSATERERQQKQTAARMNTVISTALDGVIVSNAEGRIIEFSAAAETIFGHKAEDVVGKEIGEVIVPDHMRDAHNAGMERMRSGGKKHVVGKGRVTLEAKHASGDIFPVELAIQSAITDEGEVFIAFLRDISKRVADEAELVAARDKALAGEKMKTDFLATMSHEIRTPLNGLLGNMDLLRDTALNAAQDQYVRNMETSGRLLMSHISDVLDITRYDAGKLSTRFEPVDISSLLQDIIDSQSSMAAANETTLDWGWDGPPQNWVNSDHDRLQHVLMNLIGNAVKFTKRGKVSLTARANQSDDQHHLTFEISDTGPGMPSELVDRIFDDFVTGNTAYDRDVGGTGLGLSIAKRFVSALNGEISVDSTVGKGSTFVVRLPVKPVSAPDNAEEASAVGTAAPRMKILLVEDNEINRVVAREMLEADGHHVTEAFNGQQGVTKALATRFDLILMDISMPVMDGRAATRAIRSGGGPSADTRIVALTANAMIEEQENFVADGMNGILTKPLSKAALRHALQLGEDTFAAAFVDDQHVSETREALGDEAYVKLVARFNTEMEDLIDWLETVQSPDRADVASRAHKAAGTASVFGAKALREHLRRIETAANAGEDRKVIKLIDQLPSLWQASRAALN